MSTPPRSGAVAPAASAARAAHPRVITVSANGVTRVLGGIALALALMSTALQLMVYVGGHDVVFGLVDLFGLNNERNVPTGFSILILLGAAQVLQVIAVIKWRDRDRSRFHWSLLCVGFIAMAADEGFEWHERLAPPMKALLHREHLGLFNYTWVVAAIPLLAVLAAVFLPFLKRLPTRSRNAFILAGAMYIGGAVGFEMLGGWYVELHGPNHLEYAALWTIEESLEMAGLIYFIRSLLVYLAREYGRVELAFAARRTPGRTAVGS